MLRHGVHGAVEVPVWVQGQCLMGGKNPDDDDYDDNDDKEEEKKVPW